MYLHVRRKKAFRCLAPALIVFALGQGAGAAPSEAPPAPTSAPAVSPEPPMTLGSRDELTRQFMLLREAQAQKDAAREAQAHAALVARKLAAGWPNLFAFSRVLERDAQAAMKEGRHREALKLAEFARDLSPSSAAARVLVLGARARATPTAVGALFRDLHGALKLAASDYLLASALTADLAVALVVFLLILSGGMLVFIFLHKLRYVAHDVRLLLPRGAHIFHAYGVIFFLLAAAASLRVGFVAVAFVLVLLPFIHADLGVRLLASVFFLTLCLMPLGFTFIAERLSAQSGKGADLYRLTRTLDGGDAEGRLTADLARSESAPLRLALGLYAKRAGKLEPALAHFSLATKLAPTRADAWVNLGAVQFLLGQEEPALKSFEKAIALDPRSVPALFNASRLYYRQARHQAGTEAFNRALAADTERADAYMMIGRALGPLFLAEETLPIADLWKAGRYASERALGEDAARALYPLFMGPLGNLDLAIAGGAWLALLWALALALRRVTTALPCPRCGRPICLRTDTELPDRSLCGQCYHVFVVGDVDTAARIAKELECRRYEQRRQRLQGLLALAYAGSAHLMRGRVAWGGALMTMSAVAYTVLLFATALAPTPLRLGLPAISWILLAFGVIMWLTATSGALIVKPQRD